MHDDQPPVVAAILHRLTVLVVATCVLAVVVIGVVVFVIVSTVDARSRADGANAALCTLRADYRDRVHTTEDFIEAHPAGALGFSPEQLAVQLRQQRRTVDSLSTLDCPARLP